MTGGWKTGMIRGFWCHSVDKLFAVELAEVLGCKSLDFFQAV